MKTVLLMFCYSFLLMAAYNAIKPATRSIFIEGLGVDNLPYVQLASGAIIGFIMIGYSWLMARLPRKMCLPIAQGGIAIVLALFWLLFQGEQKWVPIAFYLLGLILGILLISQFWTLANVVFDARQAKRLFGFIGGGSSLGGILGSSLALKAETLGTTNLLLCSAGLMVLSVIVAWLVVRREGIGDDMRGVMATTEKGVSSKEAIHLLRSSKHLRLIALVISFAAIGAAIIEQQLNMAAAVSQGSFAQKLVPALKLGNAETGDQATSILSSAGISPKTGWNTERPVTPLVKKEVRNSIGAAADSGKLSLTRGEAIRAFQELEAKGNEDAITAFLAKVQLWTSVIGLLVQVFLTSRIHQHLGIGFALLLLPVGLGSTATIMLFNAARWAPALARILDQSLRYTVDKTTREVLYMPLPSEMKFSAKPFVDVTVDRFAKGLAATLILFLIKPWGLGLTWQRLSWASIAITGVWIVMALRARRGYKEAFLKSIDTRGIKPAEVTVAAADLSTIETLIQELASPDEQRVVYAIDFLESLNKKQLITPLLLYHESPAVRARALSVIRSVQPELSARWFPAIQSMMSDPDPNVRAEAVGALADMKNQEATELVRPLLKDENPRISLTAAMVLAGSGREEDVARAEDVLGDLLSDTRQSAAPVRRDFAIAIRKVTIPHFRRLLIPLLSDPNPGVAEEAMLSTRKLGSTDFIFVPTLIALLRNRQQKSSARELLVGFGERVLPILGHFMRDPEEDIWIRRHIPATIARIPCQTAMSILVEALEEKDGFLRFHVIAAMERIHRLKPELTFDHHRVESWIQQESLRYSRYRRLYRVLFESQPYPKDSLLARSMTEKMKRGVDRIYRLLTLFYPWKDIAAARHSIEHGDARSRAGTLEYLDNLLSGALRKTLVPLLEDAPADISFSLETRSSVETAIVTLVHDEDPVVASAAIYFIWQQRLSNLADELDNVLSIRDVRDRHVLESASWVLQELRTPVPKRRLMWIDPLPSVELANQMRSLPIFGAVTVDEIFRICDMGRQMRSEPGRLLCQEASVPESIQFLLNGNVVVTRPGEEARQVEAPAVLAFQEVLEERPMSETVRTTDMAVCLTLTSEEIQGLLADNSDLVPGLFQMLCRGSQSGRVVVKGLASQQSSFPEHGNLDPIEKGMVLRSIPIFSRVSPDEILALATVTAEVSLAAGTDLFTEADRPAIFALISGELLVEGPDAPPITARPTDVIGIYETLAGIGFEFHGRVMKEGIALRIDREELFDLLIQRSALLRQVFGALFRNQAAMAASAAV